MLEINNYCKSNSINMLNQNFQRHNQVSDFKMHLIVHNKARMIKLNCKIH